MWKKMSDVTDFKLPNSDSENSDDNDFSYDLQDSDRTYFPSELEETHQTAMASSDDDDSYETALSRPASVLPPQIPNRVLSITEKVEKGLRAWIWRRYRGIFTEPASNEVKSVELWPIILFVQSTKSYLESLVQRRLQFDHRPSALVASAHSL